MSIWIISTKKTPGMPMGVAALAEEQTAQRARFEITDAGGANWYLKTLRNLEKREGDDPGADGGDA